MGSATDSNVNNGDTIEDEARLGDEVELEITVHNEFSSSSNIEIEDVKIDMVVQDLDDGSDLEKDTSEFKVRDDQKKKQSLHFTVPDNIEEGTYKINLKVVGQDENGARHSDEWNINLEVEKRNHDLLIREFRFSPNNGLACGETIKSLVTRIENRGSNFEEDVRITIEQDKLDVYIEQVFELDNDLDDEDSEYRKTHTVLVPSDAEAGVYPFTLWVYYDEDVPFDYSEQTLVVEDCADQATQPKDDDSGDDDGTVVITSPPTVQQPPEPEQQQELVDEPWFVAALAIVAVVILGMLLAVVKILVAPRR